VQAATRAAAVAHAHGLRFIVVPALNLSTVLNPGRREPRWRQFLGLNLVGPLARAADFVELQAQSLERDTATYTAFVHAAASQASAANPRVTVLAGLSTNPPGAPVDSHYLTAAIRATRSMVDGYWLNIPGQGARCPTCNAPRPEIAIQTRGEAVLTARGSAPGPQRAGFAAGGRRAQAAGGAASTPRLNIPEGSTGIVRSDLVFLPSQARRHERCRAKAEFQRQIGPERRIGARAIDKQGSQPGPARTQPDHSHRHIRGWFPAEKGPHAKRGVRSSEAACLRHAPRTRRDQFEGGANTFRRNHAGKAGQHQRRATHSSYVHPEKATPVSARRCLPRRVGDSQ